MVAPLRFRRPVPSCVDPRLADRIADTTGLLPEIGQMRFLGRTGVYR
jgi:hypothetical protein